VKMRDELWLWRDAFPELDGGNQLIHNRS
jgi:hypothetical protein